MFVFACRIYCSIGEKVSQQSSGDVKQKAFNPCCGICSSQTRRKMKCRTHRGIERKQREKKMQASYMHIKYCGRHNLVWFYGGKKSMLTKNKGEKSRINRGLPCKGKGTFLQDISNIYFMCFLSWSHVLSISLRCKFYLFSSTFCCNSFKSLVSYISPSPKGAINRLHPHIHYSKRYHSAISSAVNSQSWSSAAIILVMDYNWFTLKQQYTSRTDGT